MVRSKTAFVVYGVHKDGLKDPDGNLFIDYDLIARSKEALRAQDIELVEEDGQTKFRTKGDANEIHDEMLVTKAQVIGTPVFCVPYIGYAVNYIQRPPGLYTAISVGAVMLLLLLLPDLIFGEEPKKKAQEDPAAEGEKNNDPVDARLEE